jgi:HK97 family phage major capsid protein
MSTTLAALDRKLQQKRGELQKLFEDHRTAEGEYDLTPEQCDEVQQRNAELTELGKQYDQAKAVYAIASKNAEDLARQAELGRRPAHEGGQERKEREGRAERPVVSVGDAFVHSRAFREFAAGEGKGPSIILEDVDVKTLMSTSAGWAPETIRTGRVESYPTQPPVVADIIPQTTTIQAAVVYMEETTFTNSAAEAAEGGSYAEGALALTERTSDVRKIAVFLPITDEQMEDEPRVRDYVNNRLGFFLRQRLDQQILVGNGSAPNLRGVNNVSGILTQAKGVDPVPDAIYKAIIKVRSQGFTEPSHVVLHPNDWQDIRLLRTADGIHIWGSPAEVGPERIWGKPVVQSTYQTENTAVVGDFPMFSELAVRRGIEVQVTNSHSTYFVEGKLAIRADMRAALIFYRPKAFCTVTSI